MEIVHSVKCPEVLFSFSPKKLQTKERKMTKKIVYYNIHFPSLYIFTLDILHSNLGFSNPSHKFLQHFSMEYIREDNLMK